MTDTHISADSLFNLHDKVAVITGGASGIGRAAVIQLLALGARVVALDRNGEALEALRSELTDTGVDGRLVTRTLDVTELAHLKSTAQWVADSERRIDILVTSAGVVRADNPDGPGREDFDLMIDVNVRGTMNSIAAVKPFMKAQRSGSIVLLGSVVAQLGWPARMAYCASKAAVHGLARAAAVELAPHNVRVNVVAPGLVWTPMIEAVVRAAPDPARAFAARSLEQANGRMLRAEEVANAIVFFASNFSAPATGCIHDLSVGRIAGHIPSVDQPGPEHTPLESP